MGTMNKSSHDERYQSLLKFLRLKRLEKQLSVREFALILGETYQIVSKIETGTRKLSVFEYVQYCEALELDPAEPLHLLHKKGKSKNTSE